MNMAHISMIFTNSSFWESEDVALIEGSSWSMRVVITLSLLRVWFPRAESASVEHANAWTSASRVMMSADSASSAFWSRRRHSERVRFSINLLGPNYLASRNLSASICLGIMSASKRVDQIAGHLNYPKGMLAGQTAIITGSGQGIGAEAARLFAKEGAKVVVADIDASKSTWVSYILWTPADIA